MSGGGPRKEQQKLFAFLGGASTGVGDGGSAQRTIGPRARREMEDAVTALANKYFAGLFQVQDTKKVGAPSKDRIERERAVGVLSKAFCGWYFDKHDMVTRDVVEGKANRAKLTEEVQEWWGGSKEAEELRKDNNWSAGPQPQVRVDIRSSAASGAYLCAEEHSQQQEGDGESPEEVEARKYGYESGGTIQILMQAALHKWGKQGVKGGEHLGWRTPEEWIQEVGLYHLYPHGQLVFDGSLLVRG